MHVLLEVKYHIPEDYADRFVQNVKDADALVRSTVKQAAVAETARTTAEKSIDRPPRRWKTICIAARS